MSDDLWPEDQQRAAYARKAQQADPNTEWINELLTDLVYAAKSGYNQMYGNQEDVDKAKAQIQKRLAEVEISARLDERKEVALDNYRGHTFSDGTNWRGKFDKFILNNDKRIAQLTQQRDSKGAA